MFLFSNVNLGLLLRLLTLRLTHCSVKCRETQMLTRQAVLPELIFQAVKQNAVFHFSTVINQNVKLHTSSWFPSITLFS